MPGRQETGGRRMGTTLCKYWLFVSDCLFDISQPPNMTPVGAPRLDIGAGFRQAIQAEITGLRARAHRFNLMEGATPPPPTLSKTAIIEPAHEMGHRVGDE